MAIKDIDGSMGTKFVFTATLEVPVDVVAPPTYGGSGFLARPRLQRVSIIMPDYPDLDQGYPTRSP